MPGITFTGETEAKLETFHEEYLHLVSAVTKFSSNIYEDEIPQEEAFFEGTPPLIVNIFKKVIGDGSTAFRLSGGSVIPTVSEMELMIIGSIIFRYSDEFEMWAELTILLHLSESGVTWDKIERRLHGGLHKIISALERLPGMAGKLGEDKGEIEQEVTKYKTLWGQGGEELRNRKEQLEEKLYNRLRIEINIGTAASLVYSIDNALPFCHTDAFRDALVYTRRELVEIDYTRGVSLEEYLTAYEMGRRIPTRLGIMLIRDEIRGTITLPTPNSLDEFANCLVEIVKDVPISVNYLAAYEGDETNRTLVIREIQIRHLLRMICEHMDWLGEIQRARRSIETKRRVLGIKSEDLVSWDRRFFVVKGRDLFDDPEEGRNIKLTIVANIISQFGYNFVMFDTDVAKDISALLARRQHRGNISLRIEEDVALISILGIEVPRPPNTRFSIPQGAFERLERLRETLPDAFKDYFHDGTYSLSKLGQGEKLSESEIQQIIIILRRLGS